MPIPTPEPGLVISYAYLWHNEHEAGQEEGRKDRPSVIVLTVEREADDTTIVIVLPITHSPPIDAASSADGWASEYISGRSTARTFRLGAPPRARGIAKREWLTRKQVRGVELLIGVLATATR